MLERQGCRITHQLHWLTAGRGTDYLYLCEGVPVVIVQLQIWINFSFFQEPGQVEVDQDSREVNERLQQDSEHGAYCVLERAPSRRVAPR